MTCPECHAENSAVMRFCDHCAAPLLVSCQSCQTDNPAGNKFCGQCGAPLPARAHNQSVPFLPGGDGELKQVTVLFCDVRGFTSISERVPPEEVVAMLNAFYTLMIDTTFKYDGTLDKFLGDGVMAVFGAPIYHGDHSLRAIRTALAMQAGMRELSARRVTEDKAPLTIGIGINAGDAVATVIDTVAPPGR